jgi:hypothetical protein
MKVYNLTMFINDKVEYTILDEEPKVGNIVIHNGKEYAMTKVAFVNTINDSVKDISYCTCICEDITNNDKRVGVIQTMLFADVDINYLTTQVNNFLYNNRHKLDILSVDYHNFAYSIKYKHRTTQAIKASKTHEETLLRF